jgi:hypothetical protein
MTPLVFNPSDTDTQNQFGVEFKNPTESKEVKMSNNDQSIVKQFYELNPDFNKDRQQESDTNILPINYGGTGQTTSQDAINVLLPSQDGNSGKFLTTDGQNPSWSILPAPDLPYNIGSQALINGNFDIWQRYDPMTGFNNPANGTYTADRWKVFSSITGTPPGYIIHIRGTSYDFSFANGRSSVYNYRIETPDAGSNFGANDFYAITQHIENGVRLLCGGGRKFTVSLDVHSSSSSDKKIGVYAIQNYGTGGPNISSPDILFGTTFDVPSKDERRSFTFNTYDYTDGTRGFGLNQDDTLQIVIVYMWGTGNTASYVGAPGTTQDFSGLSWTVLSSVQVNAGAQALPFYPKSVGEEQAACMRYYQKLNYDTGFARLGSGVVQTSTVANIFFASPVLMRKLPTATYSALSIFDNSNRVVSAISVINYQPSGIAVDMTSSGMTAGSGALCLQNGSTSGYIDFSAEF